MLSRSTVATAGPFWVEKWNIVLIDRLFLDRCCHCASAAITEDPRLLTLGQKESFRVHGVDSNAHHRATIYESGVYAPKRRINYWRVRKGE